LSYCEVRPRTPSQTFYDHPFEDGQGAVQTVPERPSSKTSRTIRDRVKHMENCIFCKIAEGKTPAKIVYQDEQAVAFEDIHPQAPVHLLVIPRQHLASLNEATPQDEALLGHLHLIAARLASERGIATKGYRIVINNGSWAGQTVFHLHVHVMGGRVFHWPPG